jgi:hypothetical protein
MADEVSLLVLDKGISYDVSGNNQLRPQTGTHGPARREAEQERTHHRRRHSKQVSQRAVPPPPSPRPQPLPPPPNARSNTLVGAAMEADGADGREKQPPPLGWLHAVVSEQAHSVQSTEHAQPEHPSVQRATEHPQEASVHQQWEAEAAEMYQSAPPHGRRAREAAPAANTMLLARANGGAAMAASLAVGMGELKARTVVREWIALREIGDAEGAAKLSTLDIVVRTPLGAVRGIKRGACARGAAAQREALTVSCVATVATHTPVTRIAHTVREEIYQQAAPKPKENTSELIAKRADAGTSGEGSELIKCTTYLHMPHAI